LHLMESFALRPIGGVELYRAANEEGWPSQQRNEARSMYNKYFRALSNQQLQLKYPFLSKKWSVYPSLRVLVVTF
jgi:hypothetical protein